eukprot:1193358-Amphidinium_carterae.1
MCLFGLLRTAVQGSSFHKRMQQLQKDASGPVCCCQPVQYRCFSLRVPQIRLSNSKVTVTESFGENGSSTPGTDSFS